MVLCKYFQIGSCRFGTKCANEHFDVKQIVKSDVESAISGKQWPFSSFGPFKDKPSIPDFIDDQSFEEIRFLCYEAKQKNYFDAFQQQFAKEALEATNKMKVLLQLTPDVVEMVINVYDAPSDVSAAGAAVAAAKSSVGSSSGNPFGMSATVVAGGNSNSLFNKPTTATAGGNVFGGSFGNASANNSGGGGSIFGGGSSIFGQQQVAANASSSIFGGGLAAGGGSLFAQQQQPASMATTTPGGGGGLFAQAVNPSSGGGLFAQAAQQIQSPPSGLFAQAAPQPTSIFAAQPNNPFAQPQQLQQPQTLPTSLGGGGGGLFATASAQSQNLFAQQNQPAAASTNIFAQPQQQQPPAGFFQQTMQQQQPAPQQPQATAPSTVYSRMEDLSAEDIAAFQADSFMHGKIPLVPPPREFIN